MELTPAQTAALQEGWRFEKQREDGSIIISDPDGFNDYLIVHPDGSTEEDSWVVDRGDSDWTVVKPDWTHHN